MTRPVEAAPEEAKNGAAAVDMEERGVCFHNSWLIFRRNMLEQVPSQRLLVSIQSKVAF